MVFLKATVIQVSSQLNPDAMFSTLLQRNLWIWNFVQSVPTNVRFGEPEIELKQKFC